MAPNDVTRSASAPTGDGRPLLRLKIRSFRAFRDEASLDLRPLTLLYGRNQSGKSSLLRLTALLADSLQPGARALDLQSPSLRGATFKELGWMGRDPALSPWITIMAPATSPEPTLVLQLADDKGLIVNQVKVLHDNQGDKFVVSLDGDVERDQDLMRARYAGKYRGADWSDTLTFRRLIPEGLPERAQEIVRSVEEALVPLSRVQWLHANRLTDGIAPSRRTRCCLADGSDLALVLREPRHRGLLGRASTWLAGQPGLGNEITIHIDASGQPRFVLGHPGRERLPLHLAGEGVRALLPILICTCWAELGRQGGDSSAPSLLAIEEPEAHLHPDLQVALFNRLLEAVQIGVPVVLETHSVHVLRAMQLAVLKGQLHPSQVGLYWVEQEASGAASIKPVEVRDDAELLGWRPQVFEQEQELAHEILDLRWRRLAAT